MIDYKARNAIELCSKNYIGQLSLKIVAALQETHTSKMSSWLDRKIALWFQNKKKFLSYFFVPILPQPLNI